MGEVFGISVDLLWKAALFWAIVAAITTADAWVASVLATILAFVTAGILAETGWEISFLACALLILAVFLGLLMFRGGGPRHVRPPGDFIQQGRHTEEGRPIPPNRG